MGASGLDGARGETRLHAGAARRTATRDGRTSSRIIYATITDHRDGTAPAARYHGGCTASPGPLSWTKTRASAPPIYRRRASNAEGAALLFIIAATPRRPFPHADRRAYRRQQ